MEEGDGAVSVLINGGGDENVAGRRGNCCGALIVAALLVRHLVGLFHSSMGCPAIGFGIGVASDSSVVLESDEGKDRLSSESDSAVSL